MDWLKLALLGLQIIRWFQERAEAAKQYDAGVDAAIAAVAAEVLKKSQFAKAKMEEINALSEEQVDDLLRRLEPGGMSDAGRKGGG